MSEFVEDTPNSKYLSDDRLEVYPQLVESIVRKLHLIITKHPQSEPVEAKDEEWLKGLAEKGIIAPDAIVANILTLEKSDKDYKESISLLLYNESAALDDLRVPIMAHIFFGTEGPVAEQVEAGFLIFSNNTLDRNLSIRIMEDSPYRDRMLEFCKLFEPADNPHCGANENLATISTTLDKILEDLK